MINLRCGVELTTLVRSSNVNTVCMILLTVVKLGSCMGTLTPNLPSTHCLACKPDIPPEKL